MGNYLGDLINELEKDDHLESFVSAGPKNYAYLKYNGILKFRLIIYCLSNLKSTKLYFFMFNGKQFTTKYHQQLVI